MLWRAVVRGRLGHAFTVLGASPGAGSPVLVRLLPRAERIAGDSSSPSAASVTVLAAPERWTGSAGSRPRSGWLAHRHRHLRVRWTGPTSSLSGTHPVTACAYLAAVFQPWTPNGTTPAPRAVPATRSMPGEGRLTFSPLSGIAVLRADAPASTTAHWPRATRIVAIAVAGLTSLALPIGRRYRAARPATVVAVVAMVWGSAVDRYPYLLIDTRPSRMAQGSGPR